MTCDPEQIVRRARALVGVRFRPQGREPETGLDCVGLVLEAFELPASRRDYRLRGSHREEIERELAQYFVSVSAKMAGDVLLCEIAADQVHLAIECGGSFIHADAGIRRIVDTPGRPRWPVVGIFRRISDSALG